jgi:2-polyprenyl-3-methyl-5-hydroxy-6-metoxy-1,4-benzoquinol methylase
MERIPEPELMNEAEQVLAYAQADFAEPHDRCIALLQACLPDLPPTGAALDLGCGPGDITLRLARALTHWTVDGLDGSPAMLHYGYEAVQKAGLEERITLQEAYLPKGKAPRDRYDLIFSNSLLHHLADPVVLWQCIHQWAKPNAAIFIMDLIRPDSPVTAAQLVTHYAANEPEILRRDFYHSLLAAYRIDEVQAQLQQAQLNGLTVKPVSDRHFIAWGHYAG